MTIIGKLTNTIEDDEQDKEQYTIPRVFDTKETELTMKKSIILSTILHPTTLVIVWIITIIMTLLGIKFPLLERPKPPVKDIEFVLVNNPEAPPIDKNTKNRADRNTRAGGIHNPKKPQAEPSPAPGAPSTAGKKQQAKKQQNSTQALVKQIQKKQAQQAQQTQKKVQKATEAPAPKHVTPKPVPPAPRPAPKAVAPKVTQNPKSAMQIPVPKTTAPKLAGSYGGPVSGTRAGSGTSSSGSSSSRPAPSFTPSSSGGASSGAGRFSSGQYGSGQAGNPGPGNPNGRPGIDAIKEPDFGPYMRELQRRIKMNWDPPKGNESKRVILLFKIAKDGRLLSVRVSKSSGIQAADKAAIGAVEMTAPFKPLPPEFKGQSVDIQFTFDYNVFGASRY